MGFPWDEPVTGDVGEQVERKTVKELCDLIEQSHKIFEMIGFKNLVMSGKEFGTYWELYLSKCMSVSILKIFPSFLISLVWAINR